MINWYLSKHGNNTTISEDSKYTNIHNTDNYFYL